MKLNERAKSWRLRLGLSHQELAGLTGYTVVAIYKFEAGERSPGVSHSDWVWHRYRMACSGAERQLRSGREFAW